MLAMLAKRLGRCGLTLLETRTRFVDFRFKRLPGRHPSRRHDIQLPQLHLCVRQVETRQGHCPPDHSQGPPRAANGLGMALATLPARGSTRALSRVLRGHYAYYGLTDNGKRIRWFRKRVILTWKRWLACRCQKPSSARPGLRGEGLGNDPSYSAPTSPAARTRSTSPVCQTQGFLRSERHTERYRCRDHIPQDGDTITLQNLQLSELDDDDFLFYGEFTSEDPPLDGL